MSKDRVSTGVRAAIALALVAGSALLAACNTVSGAGQDLKDASEATKKAITGDDSKSTTEKKE
ncbi:MAG: entericidin EcnA/B family protein [Phycisphaerae bacterium]|nr:entericidin EcnA/B family protein [Phycisphaerae bacterium]